MKWIRLWTEETYYGTTFQELNAEERGVWFSFLVMAGLPPRSGIVEMRKGVPYKMPVLAEIINCPLPDLKNACTKLTKVGKISIDKEGFIHIVKWDDYQTRYERYYKGKNNTPKYEHTEKVAQACTTEGEGEVEGEEEVEEEVEEEGEGDPLKDNILDITKEKKGYIIKYLNEKVGSSFKETTESTIKFLNARFKDGYTVRDILDVIDLKCKQWLKDPKMKSYLRPETLFRPTKFESYINEVRAKRNTRGKYNGVGTVSKDPTGGNT